MNKATAQYVPLTSAGWWGGAAGMRVGCSITDPFHAFWCGAGQAPSHPAHSGAAQSAGGYVSHSILVTWLR